MNYNYDPNQQAQYEAPQDIQYQAPLYEQQPAAIDPKPMLIMAIIGLALGATGWCTIAGIILCAIAMSKVKAYIAAGYALEGTAKVAKILSLVGLIVSIAMTVVLIFSFCFGFGIGLIQAIMEDSYYNGSYYFY